MKPARWYKPVLLLFLTLLAGLCEAHAEEFFVKRVYTGDYIKLQARSSGEKDIKLRYIGVDVPNKRGKPFFELCRDANRALVEKKKVSVQTDAGAAESPGKLYGYVFAGDVFVNAELIKNGHALAAPNGNEKYRELFVSLQQQARKARKGLWAFEDQSDEPYYVGSKSEKIFHRPACFHIKGLDFEDRLIFRTKGEALARSYRQDWRCCPLFKEPKKRPAPAGQKQPGPPAPRKK